MAENAKLNHLDLFSGIGGFALAAQWVWGKQHNIVSFVEIDRFCQKVLRKHWPNVPIQDDIRTLDYETVMAYAARFQPGRQKQRSKRERIGECSESIDLLTGGFPCQPYSVAGKQRGAADDRALWPQMYRVIRECQPRWVVGENVAGIINMELDNCIADLENEGYTVESFIVPACAVDAPHRRDRVWIVAYCSSLRVQRHGTDREQIPYTQFQKALSVCRSQDVADTKRIGQSNGNDSQLLRQGTGEINTLTGAGSDCRRMETGRWLPEPDVGRVANGVPNRVDRLKALGNAIVPQVVVPIMQAIKEINRTTAAHQY